MAELQCIICDYVVTATSTSDDDLLLLMGVTSAGAAEQLIRHMESHELADWIKAFKMADAYITQLEAELEEAKKAPSVLQNAYREQTYREVPAPAFQAPDEQSQMERMFTPAEVARMRQKAEARARIQAANPDESLIPFISPGARAEGVVGRKI